jgi:hypothetical protein
MKDYSPKRRTALVLTGSGTSGAYHAGVLRALDESGVKLDLLVGSGAGNVAAAFGAVAGGARLYGKGGFWEGVSWGSFYRLRPALRTAFALLGASFAVFLLPLLAALVAGLLFPLVLIADLALPGLIARVLEKLWYAPALLRTPYLAMLAAPALILAVIAVVAFARLYLKDRRRFGEAFEAVLDARAARERLRHRLWEVARGTALSASPPSETELGKRYVALLADNLGQPGFRELILRTTDLETGGALCFVLLQEPYSASFAASRASGRRSRLDSLPAAVDLRAPDHDVLLFDAVVSGLLPPLAAPLRRVRFPRGGLHGGETHRITEAALAGGSGISEALAAGAEQVIVVSATPEAAVPLLRRRGPRALGDGLLATLERQAVDRDVGAAERINRMVETVGHRTQDGRSAWQDPATGRLYRDFALYVVRPAQRSLGPLELDPALDPATDAERTPGDLIEQGYRDAYRLFIEPVVGASPEPRGREAVESEERSPVEL